MFAVIRFLFIAAVLVIGFGSYNYLRTDDKRWLRLINYVLYFVLALLLMFFAGLALQRLNIL